MEVEFRLGQAGDEGVEIGVGHGALRLSSPPR
jgi:hypothetical protein